MWRWLGLLRAPPVVRHRQRRAGRRYCFQDEWTVAAPPEVVWALISDPTTFPAWWPIYREAMWLEDRGGVGSRARLTLRVLLPYSLTLITCSTRVEQPHLLEGTVSGELEGSWRWRLERVGQATWVRFEEEVATRKHLLDLLAAVAFPHFQLNHRVAARRGALGMRAYLRGDR